MASSSWTQLDEQGKREFCARFDAADKEGREKLAAEFQVSRTMLSTLYHAFSPAFAADASASVDSPSVAL